MMIGVTAAALDSGAMGYSLLSNCVFAGKTMLDSASDSNKKPALPTT